MRNNRKWAGILGVENAVVEAVEFSDELECVVVFYEHAAPGNWSGGGSRPGFHPPTFVHADAAALSCVCLGVAIQIVCDRAGGFSAGVGCAVELLCGARVLKERRNDRTDGRSSSVSHRGLNCEAVVLTPIEDASASSANPR